jgi:hypothetical protein
MHVKVEYLSTTRRREGVDGYRMTLFGVPVGCMNRDLHMC